MKNNNILLSLKNVWVKFKVRGRELTAIRGISLDIYENEAIAIVGESGSGKSVLTKALSGMLDSNGYISEGEILFNNNELSETNAKLNYRAKRIINIVANKLNITDTRLMRIEDEETTFWDNIKLFGKIINYYNLSKEDVLSALDINETNQKIFKLSKKKKITG